MTLFYFRDFPTNFVKHNCRIWKITWSFSGICSILVVELFIPYWCLFCVRSELLIINLFSGLMLLYWGGLGINSLLFAESILANLSCWASNSLIFRLLKNYNKNISQMLNPTSSVCLVLWSSFWSPNCNFYTTSMITFE